MASTPDVAAAAAWASSLDGRAFTGRLPDESDLVIGDLVVLESGDGAQLLGPGAG